MELSFWESKWRQGQIGFHMSEVYPSLRTYLPKFGLDADATILVPLCGKSLDINWLADQGFHVIGVELAVEAVQEVIRRTPDDFMISTKAGFSIYRANSMPMEIWQGDIMKLQPNWVSKADLVYDKAALIALPPEKRYKYTCKVQSLLTDKGAIFQQTFEYPQSEMNGPPFSVRTEELKEYYGDTFAIELLLEQEAPNLLQRFQNRGLHSYLIEKIYCLSPQVN